MKYLTFVLLCLSISSFAAEIVCHDYTDNLYPYKEITVKIENQVMTMTFRDAPGTQNALIYTNLIESDVKFTASREELILPIGRKGTAVLNIYKNPLKLQKLGTVGPGMFYPLATAMNCELHP